MNTHLFDKVKEIQYKTTIRSQLIRQLTSTLLSTEVKPIYAMSESIARTTAIASHLQSTYTISLGRFSEANTTFKTLASNLAYNINPETLMELLLWNSYGCPMKQTTKQASDEFKQIKSNLKQYSHIKDYINHYGKPKNEIDMLKQMKVKA